MKKISIILIAIMILTVPVTSLAMNEEDKQITREEFIKEIILQAELDIEETLESSFIDVTNPDTISYIETAYINGYVSGYEQKFRPEDPITKEQAVIIIVRVFGELAGVNEVSQEDINNTLNFTDTSSISPWAKTYITYALDKGLISVEGNSFYGQALLTKEQMDKIISQANEVYKELFTKDGLSASDLLVVANKKMLEYDTYKQEGTMEMQMQMNIEGISEEEMLNNKEIQMLNNEGTNLILDIEIEVQNPDKYYIKEIIKSDQIEESINQEIEIFMDGTIMYSKMANNDKWIKQDISDIISQMQSLSSNDPSQMAQLSEEQLRFFKKYARYEENEEENTYIVSVDINKDSYKEYYMEIMEKSMDSIIELQVNNPQLKQTPGFDQEQYRQMIMEIMSKLDIEVQYKFFINKDTKDYEKMEVVQDLYISMDNLISMIQQMSEEEANDISVEMTTHTEGAFDFYDFNEKINLPIIQPEDVLETLETVQ